MNKKYEFRLLLLSFLAGIFGIYLIFAVKSDEPIWLDDSVTALLFTSNEWVLKVFGYITELGSSNGIASISLLTILWLWIKKKDFSGMATIALAIGLGNEVNKWLKNWVGRPRPELEHLDPVNTLSFPSGHAMVGTILYMLLAYLLIKYIPSLAGKRLIVISFSLLIVLIGMSRIILQVHYPSDVFAGFAFGFIWAFLWILMYEYLKKITIKQDLPV